MNATNLKELLKYHYISNKAVLINGKHGIGKSSVVQQFGKENNLFVQILNLSLMEPGDLLGMPDIDLNNERKRTNWVEPIWFQEIVDKAWPVINKLEDLEFNDENFKKHIISKNKETFKRSELNNWYCEFYNLDNSEIRLLENQNKVHNKKSQNSVLFLDELNRASPDTRQPSLQLTLDKKLQCHKLPFVRGKQTFIVSAINPADLYQTDDLDIALLDRFTVVELDIDVNDWLKYAISINVNECIISYISENPEHLHNMQEEGKGSSPRSWCELSELLENNIENKIVLENTIKGKLGKEVGINFYVYYQNYNNIFKIENLVELVFNNKNKKINEISEVLKDKLHNIETIRKHSILNQLLLMSENELKNENYNIISLTLISFLMSLNFEISIMFAKKLKSENPELYSKLALLDEKLNNKLFFTNLIKYSR